jgi:hypothetical protein
MEPSVLVSLVIGAGSLAPANPIARVVLDRRCDAFGRRLLRVGSQVRLSTLCLRARRRWRGIVRLL